MHSIKNRDRILAYCFVAGIFLVISLGIFILCPNNLECMTPGNTFMKVETIRASVGSFNYLYKSLTHPLSIQSIAEKNGIAYDPTLPLSEQVYSKKTGITWEQYLFRAAREQLENVTFYASMAMKNNIGLEEEQEAEIESILEKIDAEAKSQNMLLKQYFSLNYGENVGKKTIRKVLTWSYLAQNYFEFYMVSSMNREKSETVDNAITDPEHKEMCYSLREIFIPAEQKEQAKGLSVLVSEGDVSEYLFSVLADFYETQDDVLEGGLHYLSEKDHKMPTLSAWLCENGRKKGDLFSIEGKRGNYFFFYRGFYDYEEEKKIYENGHKDFSELLNSAEIDYKFGYRRYGKMDTNNG